MSDQETTKRVALITGAAGFLGSKISAYLSESGKNIVGVYRNKLPTALKNLLPICCDLKSIDSLLPPLKTVDTVLHLAWEGGVLGVASHPKGQGLKNASHLSENVTLTRNLVEAMERAKTRKIIFISWVGVDRRSNNQVLREKYWAENVVINSKIPEKIILRIGIVTGQKHDNPFFKSAAALGKIPYILPLPKEIDRLVFTSIDDLFAVIDKLVTSQRSENNGCQLIDLTSTTPESIKNVLVALDNKVRGKPRIVIGGLVGRGLFSWIDQGLVPGKIREPSVLDFFALSRLAKIIPGEGIPINEFGLSLGQKSGINQAF